MGTEPIRILHISGAMNRGGQETLIMELYRHMDRTKVQFDFLLYNYSGESGAYDDEIRQLGGKIYTAQRRFYNGPVRFLKELDNFFKTHPEYRIVHAHQYMMSGYMLWRAKKQGRITIAHSHAISLNAGLLRRVASSVGKFLIKANADYVFGCSEQAIKVMCDENSDGRTRILIKNAVDITKFTFSKEKRDEWREKINVDSATVVIGTVARFSDVKNHDFIIDIFEQVVAKNENSVLALVGDGEKRKAIEEKVKSKGLSDKVRFLGARSDVADIYNSFDVSLVPSKYEGLGIVAIEAQANGLPCILSKDVIPEEADVGAGLVHRVSLSEPAEVWARECLNAGGRLTPELAQQAVKNAGYDITEVAHWLQEFYLEHSEA